MLELRQNHPGPGTLETERLRLRPFTADDLDGLAPILADPKVMRYSLNGPKTRLQTFGLISRCLDDYAALGFGLRAVALSHTDRLIGYCGLVPQRVAGADEIELGYRLTPSCWGKGFATEAADACREEAFGRLGLRRFVSIIEPANAASARVAEKIGMRIEKRALFHGKEIVLYVQEAGA